MYINRDNPIKYILFYLVQVGGGGIVRDPLVHKEVAVLLCFQPCSGSNAIKLFVTKYYFSLFCILTTNMLLPCNGVAIYCWKLNDNLMCT